MLILGLAITAIAALIHVYIWVLESFLWTRPRARALFGTSESDAHTMKALAFNQGFYNLFLAIMIFVGTALVIMKHETAGVTLVTAGAGAMAAAGVVLLLSDRTKTGAALKQLLPPLTGVALVGVSTFV